jgi:arabinogalactan endo-1,4-beta-galactosidase
MRGWLVPLVLVSACTASEGPSDRDVQRPDFIGADISALERIEAGGTVFRAGGQPGDAIAILRDRGSNLFRLRLFVDPSGQDVEVNDLAYTIRMATRVKAAGGNLLLDLHYSDTWADPGHQATPSAWSSLDMAELEQQVEVYTSDVLTQMRLAGIVPDFVQVGNEIDWGMLWPLGQLSSGSDSLTQWSAFARLLQAGVRGVRGAVATQDSVRIVLHYSAGGNLGGTQWFFDHLAALNVPYDVIGLSYYPWWHGTLAQLKANMAAAAQRYNRDIMVVETAYPWRSGGWEGMVTNPGAMRWAVSSQGQAEYLGDLLSTVAAAPSGRGIGVLWWYPEAIETPGLFIWGGGSLALFNSVGNVLPAASQFGGH